MLRHELLKHLHTLLQPRTYFEIGVNKGASLALSRAKTIAVDPFYAVENEILCDLHLVRATSDEFFARRHPLAHFDEPRIDLAFIDGMHLSEYALRDVMNVERYCHAGSVIVLDDMLPRNIQEAGRTRRGSSAHGAWAGDVYKIVKAFHELRPDLVCLEVDTRPTGTVILMTPDSRSTALTDAYDGLVADFVVPDPQEVPTETLNRTRAVSPAAVVTAPIWDTVRSLRTAPDDRARPEIRSLLAGAGLIAEATVPVG
ncbi:MAG TPA: class I SAM-dependent methyltransferase [Nocardioidaceae bacterium]|nr:class I SAM-dependent methyltransferase [Nocardioidaceae bacterium]